MKISIKTSLKVKVSSVAVKIERKPGSRRSKNRSAIITFSANFEVTDEDLVQMQQEFFDSHGIEVKRD